MVAIDNVLVKLLPIQGDFAWLNFAVVGIIIGLLLSLVQKDNK